MNPTPSEMLSRHAPEPTVNLDHVLEHVHRRASIPSTAAPRRRRSLRGRMATAVAAAVAAGALVVAPSMLGNPQPAAALAQLAQTASEQSGPVIPEGKYLRLIVVENPDGVEGDVHDAYPRTREVWTDSQGNTTFYDTEGLARKESSFYVPETDRNAPAGYPNNSLSYVRGLPTDAKELDSLLRSGLADGGLSRDERIFTFLSDVLITGYAPPEVNRAAIAAMANLDNISVERSSSYRKQPCLRVSFAEPKRAGLRNHVCFNESDATLLETGNTSPVSLPFLTVVMSREILDEGPAKPVDPVRTNN